MWQVYEETSGLTVDDPVLRTKKVNDVLVLCVWEFLLDGG